MVVRDTHKPVSNAVRCGECGGPIRPDNRTGFCSRWPSCRRSYRTAYRARCRERGEQTTIMARLLTPAGVPTQVQAEQALARRYPAMTPRARTLASVRWRTVLAHERLREATSAMQEAPVAERTFRCWFGQYAELEGVGLGARSVRRWVARFAMHGVDGLLDRRTRSGRRAKPADQGLVAELLHLVDSGHSLRAADAAVRNRAGCEGRAWPSLSTIRMRVKSARTWAGRNGYLWAGEVPN